MAAEQQVQLTDLEPIQLQEVKKQLDQVSVKDELPERFQITKMNAALLHCCFYCED